MIAIPFFYFLIVAVWFYRRNHKLGIDVAAASLLVMISFFAIVIDVKEIYGDFGINRVSYTLPTLILFCLQWMPPAGYRYSEELPKARECRIRQQ